jgi:tetratricopeptide (TPR) repeat protein
MDHIQRTLKKTPEYLIELGNALIEDSNFVDAINVLSKAKKISPDKEVYYNLSYAYKAINNYKDAESELLFITNAIPKLTRGKYLLAKLYFETNQNEKFLRMADLIDKNDTNITTSNSESEMMKREIKVLRRTLLDVKTK